MERDDAGEYAVETRARLMERLNANLSEAPQVPEAFTCNGVLYNGAPFNGALYNGAPLNGALYNGVITI